MMMASKSARQKYHFVIYFVEIVAVFLWQSHLIPLGSANVIDTTTDGATFICTKDGKRCDTHPRCPVWKDDGECIRMQTYMNKHCPGSCENVRAIAIQESNVDISNGNCRDRHDDCSAWAKLGECDTNSDMRKYCAVSCGICQAEPAAENEEGSDPTCTDEHENCGFWAGAGECDANPNYMKQYCKKSCKACKMNLNRVLPTRTKKATGAISDEQQKTTEFGSLQTIEGARKDEVLQRVKESIAYMESDSVLELDESLRTKCQNRNELCAFWAVIGECEKNAAYMKTNCAPSCMTCHLIDMSLRCPKLGDDVEAALYPGDLNKMFDRIIRRAPGNRSDLTEEEQAALRTSDTPIYTVHVHSQPELDVTQVSAALDKSTPPWVVTLDNFLTAEECETMIQLGYKYEYKVSMDVGGQKFDGSHEGVLSERRTSENAWCSRFGGCRNETIPTRIHQRMADVLGVPPENSEDMQVLKYEVGQF
jgi:prolyl 4-hydroxylase